MNRLISAMMTVVALILMIAAPSPAKTKEQKRAEVRAAAPETFQVAVDNCMPS